MDDIVTRLRVPAQHALVFGNIEQVNDERHDAADEIERWQNIARNLYLFIQDPCTHNHWCDVCSSIDEYEKAVCGE